MIEMDWRWTRERLPTFKSDLNSREYSTRIFKSVPTSSTWGRQGYTTQDIENISKFVFQRVTPRYEHLSPPKPDLGPDFGLGSCYSELSVALE